MAMLMILCMPHLEAKRTSLGILAWGDLFRRGTAICVPDNIRELYDSPYSGHVGMNRNHKLSASRFQVLLLASPARRC